MADQDELNACKEAYQAGIIHLNMVLLTQLAEAQTPEQKQQATDEFKRGVALCKEAHKICLECFA